MRKKGIIRMVMNMNNKGFAISTVLYGLVILMSLLLFLLLGTMSFSRDNNSKLVEQIEEELNDCVWQGTC